VSKYLVGRFASLLLALWVIATLTFCLMRAIPGDPLIQEKSLPKEVVLALRHHYGLDRPLFSQYLNHLKSIAVWDLGPSFTYKGQTVNQIIAEGFPISAMLGAEAFVLALGGGVLLGTIAAMRRKKWQERSSTGIAILCMALPSFLLAALLQYLFTSRFRILPVAGWGGFTSSILPALSLAAFPAGFIARLTCSSMVEVLQCDYLKLARAKGLRERDVIVRHAWRNGLLPLLGYLGPFTATILIGSFAVEKIFGIPGLGHWFVQSISNRDYPLIMGITVFYSILLLGAVFAADLIHCSLDPRIREQKR
jgi:oligopeptide transport system permease protein